MGTTETPLPANKELAEIINPYLGSGAIQFFKAEPDGTLEYLVHCDNHRLQGTLKVHPENLPASWDTETFWTLETELFRDRECFDTCGTDVEALDTLDDLSDWLRENAEPQP